MVGPGEVDDELQAEVREECSKKYGSVKKCLVYEVTSTDTKKINPEEAVRIFVEFNDGKGAQNGKFSFMYLCKLRLPHH